ncbi:hypothetical protein, partial [Mesorhizobium sp. M8A.F.Ca.ET.207.01.1.1]|uniref:hypothetical protein n=1 Tax=Mesorhizobium sp. M8A.F.Ca.ET.207.01.1.1 TaxID=2563968 RepID=UPI001AED38E1
ATFGFRDDLFADRKLLHINIDSGEIDKVYKADGAVIADAKLAVGTLLNKMAHMLEPSVSAYREATDYSDEHILHLTGKIHPGQMAQSLSKRL